MAGRPGNVGYMYFFGSATGFTDEIQIGDRISGGRDIRDSHANHENALKGVSLGSDTGVETSAVRSYLRHP